MDSFGYNVSAKVNLKVRSLISEGSWYMINIKHMMVNIASENLSSTGSHDKFYPGISYPMRLDDEGLKYYDQNCSTWVLMEEVVQRAFSDYVADKELLGGS